MTTKKRGDAMLPADAGIGSGDKSALERAERAGKAPAGSAEQEPDVEPAKPAEKTPKRPPRRGEPGYCRNL